MTQKLTVIDNDSKELDIDLPRTALTRLEHVRDEMARVYRNARTGKIETQEATRLTYILNALAKIIESERTGSTSQGAGRRQREILMASLEKRVEVLEQHQGVGHKPTEIVYMNAKNYKEKQKEVERLEADGYFVIAICGVAAKNGKPDPDHVEYHRWLDRNKAKDDPGRILRDE